MRPGRITPSDDAIVFHGYQVLFQEHGTSTRQAEFVSVHPLTQLSLYGPETVQAMHRLIGK